MIDAILEGQFEMFPAIWISQEYLAQTWFNLAASKRGPSSACINVWLLSWQRNTLNDICVHNDLVSRFCAGFFLLTSH